MEHIFNIAINMDDETIKRQVAEKAFEQICELCCQLQERVNLQSKTIKALRCSLDK